MACRIGLCFQSTTLCHFDRDYHDTDIRHLPGQDSNYGASSFKNLQAYVLLFTEPTPRAAFWFAKGGEEKNPVIKSWQFTVAVGSFGWQFRLVAGGREYSHFNSQWGLIAPTNLYLKDD